MKPSLFNAFLKNPKRVGAITPSSKFLAEKLTKHLNFKTAKCIVELGSGTGSVTNSIMEKINHNTDLLCFEIDPLLSGELKKKFDIDPRITIIKDDAKNLYSYLNKKADYIVSTLPLGAMSKFAGEIILKAIKKSLKPKGVYTQIQYSLLNKKEIENIFPNTKVSLFPLNIPPVFIYSCQK